MSRGNTLTVDQGSTAPLVAATLDVRPKVNKPTRLQDQLQHYGASQMKDNTFRSHLQSNTGMPPTTPLKHQSQNATSTNVPFMSIAAQEQKLQSQSIQNTAPFQNTVGHDAICGIMQRQNEITSMLV